MIIQTNPLLIDVVLEKVLEYLGEKDLKSCRLVCTQWFDPATRSLQKVSKAIVFGDLYKVNLIRLRPDIETIKLFTSTMIFPAAYGLPLPYTKFDLKPSLFAKSNLHLLEKFFKYYGPTIQLLNINLAYESVDNFPENCFPNLNLENLKSLDFCNTVRGEMRPSLRTDLLTKRYNLLKTILDAAPNLQTLSFWCDSENVVWPGEVIEVLRKTHLPYLRNLKISFPMTNYQLVNISRINVHLTSFTFLIREPLFNTKSFCEVLSSQNKTLRNLKLIDLQCDTPKYLEIPQMNELRTLEIEGAFYGDDCQFCFINFTLKKLPKLERILLRNCHRQNFDLDSFLSYPNYYDNNNFSQQGRQVCKSIVELHVTLCHDFINAAWIVEISKMFPNLKNLHVMFSAESKGLLLSVFSNLTNLESLTLNVRKCGESLDTVLTGMNANAISEQRMENYREFKSKEINEKDLNFDSTPRLLHLKNLKVLEFKGEHRNYKEGTSPFTEASVYLAFLQMRSLRNVVLWQTGMNLSKESIYDLGQRFHLVQILPEE